MMLSSLPSDGGGEVRDAVPYDWSYAMDRIDSWIRESASDRHPLIQKMTDYVVASGGKRLRARLTLACGHFWGPMDDALYAMAAAIECLHTATLMHDDVVDRSPLRRGQPSAPEVFGNAASVLVGDFLFSQSFDWMVRYGNRGALGLLASASCTIAEGEVMQLSVIGDLGLSFEDYCDVIRTKTAALFTTACQLGAWLYDRTEWLPVLERYGSHLGLVFQMADDLLDYMAADVMHGKRRGDDFLEGKVTLPLILLRGVLDPESLARLEGWFADAERSEVEVSVVCGWMEDHGIVEACLAVMEPLALEAKSAVGLLPVHPMQEELRCWVDGTLDHVRLVCGRGFPK
jgi:octaprenyl-diphosphate synthase